MGGRPRAIAKLSPPTGRGLVARHRLYARLDPLLEGGVAWLSAPGGSGKTSLVASWLAERKPQAIWYQVDAGDSDLATFFHYLALAAPDDDTAAEPLPPLTPEYALGRRVFAARWFERFFARFDPPFVLVLDNLQEVPSEAPLHEALSVAIAQLPEGVALVLISRADPGPPYMRWAAGARFVRVDMEHLRLSDEEAQAIARARGHPDPAQANAVNRLACGWAAGAVLLLRALEEGLQLPVITAEVPQGVFDYFACEVFDKLSSWLRDFLMKTTMLPVVVGRIAAALTGRSDAGEILLDLARQHFFTERRGSQDPSYEYHPLFREFLANQARRSFTATQLHGMRCQAAKLLEQSGDVDGAAELFLTAGEWAELGRLCSTHAPALIAQGRNDTLARLIGSLPDDQLDREPWLRFWQGLAVLPADPGRSRRWLDRAFQIFDAQGDSLGALLACSHSASTYVYQMDFARLDWHLAAFDRILADEPRYPSADIEAQVVANLISAAVHRQPWHPRLPRAVERARELIRRDCDPRIALTLVMPLGTYLMFQGRFHSAADTLKNIESLLDTPQMPPFVRMQVLEQRAVVLWQNGEDSAALACVEQALEIGRSAGIRIMDGYLNMAGAYATLSAEDYRSARGYVEAFRRSADPSRLLEKALLRMLDAVTRMFEGDLDGAIALGAETIGDPEAGNTPFGFATLSIQFAQMLLMKGDHEGARSHLDIALRYGDTADSDITRFHALMNMAYAHLLAGQDGPALDDLRRALAIGRRRGYLNCHPYWIPKIMARVLATALAHDIEADYVRRFIRHRKLKPPSDAGESWPWPIRMRVLGGFDVLQEDKPLRIGGKAQRKPLELARMLAAFGGRTVAAATIADALWPDAEGDASQHALEMTVHRLRRLLNQPDAIVVGDAKVSLNREICWLDVPAFEEQCDRADVLQGAASDGEFDAVVQTAFRLYRGELLPHEPDASWVHAPRQRLRTKFVRLVTAAGRRWEEDGQWDRAGDLYQQAIEIDPLTESWYRGLIVCLHRRGRLAEAVAVYQRCRKILLESLQTSPSAETEAAYQALRHA